MKNLKYLTEDQVKEELKKIIKEAILNEDKELLLEIAPVLVFLGGAVVKGLTALGTASAVLSVTDALDITDNWYGTAIEDTGLEYIDPWTHVNDAVMAAAAESGVVSRAHSRWHGGGDERKARNERAGKGEATVEDAAAQIFEVLDGMEMDFDETLQVLESYIGDPETFDHDEEADFETPREENWIFIRNIDKAFRKLERNEDSLSLSNRLSIEDGDLSEYVNRVKEAIEQAERLDRDAKEAEVEEDWGSDDEESDDASWLEKLPTWEGGKIKDMPDPKFEKTPHFPAKGEKLPVGPANVSPKATTGQELKTLAQSAIEGLEAMASDDPEIAELAKTLANINWEE
jgi:hypothetical protein